MDEETGLHYFGARYYDSRISIWLSVDPLAECFPNFNPYNYTMQNPINLVDPTGMSSESYDDWYKDKNGNMKFNSKVKNQKDVDELSPGGKYVGETHKTKNSQYFKDGSAFFKNEFDGYEFMINNSNMNNDKTAIENLGFITNDGVAVLPTEGILGCGTYFKNTYDGANIYVKGFKMTGDGCALTVYFNGKKIRPIAWIHTHPASWGGGPQSGDDTQTTITLGIPSIVIGRNHVYHQSVKDAKARITGERVMTRDELKSRSIPIIYNLNLRKK